MKVYTLTDDEIKQIYLSVSSGEYADGTRYALVYDPKEDRPPIPKAITLNKRELLALYRAIQEIIAEDKTNG